jgi:hypothetical protein
VEPLPRGCDHHACLVIQTFWPKERFVYRRGIEQSSTKVMTRGNFILSETPPRPILPLFEVTILGALVPVTRITAAKHTRLGISPVPDRNGQQEQHQNELQGDTSLARISGREPL